MTAVNGTGLTYRSHSLVSASIRKTVNGRHRVDIQRAVVCASLLAVVAVATAGAAVLPVAANPTEGGEPHHHLGPVRSTTTETNATPILNENPNEVERAGDLPEVGEWLADRLSDRLSRSAENLSDGQYERARVLLGVQFDGELERHRDIANETDVESDDAASKAFETAGSTQRRFIEAVRVYRETYESFEEARDLGDYDNARELGSRLERQADDVDRTGTRLNETYRRLEENTGREFDQTQRVVQTLVVNISETQDQVRDRFFTGTQLTAEADRRQISFERPLVVNGRLVSSNGTPVGDHPITLRAGDVTRQVRTDHDGRYQFVYRPVRLPLSTSNVTIVYDPAEGSRYLASSATVPVEVHQSTPAITVSEWPESTIFRDGVAVRGNVTVSGTPVAGLTLVLAVGDHQLRETMSGPGGFRARGQLPLAVPPGNHALAIRTPIEDRAIAATSIERSITVRTAQTTLRLRASDGGNGEVAVEGRLLARDTIAVANVTLDVTIADTKLGTVRTTRTGAYATTLAVPRDLLYDGGTPVTVTVTFDPTGTNLEPATARSTAVVSPPSNTPVDERPSTGFVPSIEAWATDLSPAERGGIALAVILLVGGNVIFRNGVRRLFREGEIEVDVRAIRSYVAGLPVGTTNSDVVEAGSSNDGPPAESMDDSRPPGHPSMGLIDRAERALHDDDPDEAVTTAYAAVRRTITADLDVSSSLTHWEFLANCGTNGFDEVTLSELHALTVDYEQAVFAAESADPDRAADAVERAQRLTSRFEGSEPA